MAAKKNGKTAGGISKMEAVRRAMGELGFDATRTDIQNFVKERFNTDMSVDVISTYKADIARKATKTKRAPTPAAPKSAANATAAPRPAPTSTARAGGIDLGDIQTVKAMVGRVGATTLKTLIDVLAR
jgi:hypothetical protein